MWQEGSQLPSAPVARHLACLLQWCLSWLHWVHWSQSPSPNKEHAMFLQREDMYIDTF
jgi:hypothetical protein